MRATSGEQKEPTIEKERALKKGLPPKSEYTVMFRDVCLQCGRTMWSVFTVSKKISKKRDGRDN